VERQGTRGVVEVDEMAEVALLVVGCGGAFGPIEFAASTATSATAWSVRTTAGISSG